MVETVLLGMHRNSQMYERKGLRPWCLVLCSIVDRIPSMVDRTVAISVCSKMVKTVVSDSLKIAKLFAFIAANLVIPNVSVHSCETSSLVVLYRMVVLHRMVVKNLAILVKIQTRQKTEFG
jgi:hypothetical protein